MRSSIPLLARRRACAALALSPALALLPRAYAAPDATSYLDRLHALKSNLVRHGPAPQKFGPVTAPAGAQQVVYRSGRLELKAWAAFPPGASAAHPVPGLVFFHGGFALASDDLDVVRPLLDAGFAVLCPTLRAENGNPGFFELLLGEVDDGAAAVDWLAGQPQVDATRVYTFGHSMGGVVSALLSLRPAGIRRGGSSGGLLGPRTFDMPWLRPNIPFAPPDDPRERGVRVLVGNVAWMQREHDAYVGIDDDGQDADLAAHEVATGSRLNVLKMPGDHYTSFDASFRAFIASIKADA